jgi:hypothetical protein
MVVLRPTARLALKLRLRLGASNFRSTTRLGDWYATDLNLGRRRLVICVSELSRLAVVLDAAPYATIPERLPPALARVLHFIGVEQPTIEQEIAAMGTIAIAKTSNRSVLGTVNEFVHYLRCIHTNRPVPPDPFLLSAELVEFVCMQLEDTYPKDAALRLLSE